MTVQIGTNFDEKYVEFPPHQPESTFVGLLYLLFRMTEQAKVVINNSSVLI